MNYREGISRAAEVRYVHKKQSGGSGQFADIAVRFAPGEPGTGFEFRSDIKGGVVPKEYIPGVTKVRAGVLGGCGVWCVVCVGGGAAAGMPRPARCDPPPPLSIGSPLASLPDAVCCPPPASLAPAGPGGDDERGQPGRVPGGGCVVHAV